VQLEERRRVFIIAGLDELRTAGRCSLHDFVGLRERRGARGTNGDGIERLRCGSEFCGELAVPYRSYTGEERERERGAPRRPVRGARRPPASTTL
jgi:hypothetical protein